jgi:glucose/arabinose dehydrogenase
MTFKTGNSLRVRYPVLLACAVALSAGSACSDDGEDDDDPRTTGGRSGAAATGGRSGAATTGGASSSTGGTTDAGSAGAAAGGAGATAGGAGGDSAGAGGLSAGAGGTVGVAGESAGGAPEEAEGGSAGALGPSNPDTDVFRPEERDVTMDLIDGLTVPTGFELNVYAAGLKDARMLETHGGHVYVTQPLEGNVLLLADSDEDGVADAPVVAASDLPLVHGIVFREDQVYLATDTTVLRGVVGEDGIFADLTPIIEDLPDGGQHPRRTLGIGPDDLLYISVGSSCDACAETNPEHATILRSELDGSNRTIFARGLRNTIGFDWDPATDTLWGMDHGSDWRGDDLPPEELNVIVEGNDYGWPYCYAAQQPDPVIQPPPDVTLEEYCADTVGPSLMTGAHNAPIAFRFYDGNEFPEAYRGNAFVALHGSWNRFPPTGYAVARVIYEDGEPQSFEPFLDGFLIEDGAATFGRPAGLTLAPDGALLVSDDLNGMIYRITPAN